MGRKPLTPLIGAVEAYDGGKFGVERTLMSRVMLLKTKGSGNVGPPCKSSSRRELKTDVLCSLFVITALRCYHEHAV